MMERKIKKIDRTLEVVDWDFKLSDLSVTDKFSKLHFTMSPFINIYVPLSQEKPLKWPSHLKRQRSIAWHNYKNLRQRNESSEMVGRAVIFYDSTNDQYRNYHICHQIQEEMSLINKFSESWKNFHSWTVEVRAKNANEFSSVYFTEHLGSPDPHQVFCSNLWICL